MDELRGKVRANLIAEKIFHSIFSKDFSHNVPVINRIHIATYLAKFICLYKKGKRNFFDITKFSFL